MQQRRTKRCKNAILAAEVSPGVWEWHIGACTFRYHAGHAINTLIFAEGKWKPLFHNDCIEGAVLFSWGCWTVLQDFSNRVAEARNPAPVNPVALVEGVGA